MDYKKYFNMLLAANYLGIHLELADGHWWIKYDEDAMIDGYYLESFFVKNGVLLKDKIYDGPLQALAVIDEALKRAGHKGLLEGVYTDNWYMGVLEVDESRIVRIE